MSDIECFSKDQVIRAFKLIGPTDSIESVDPQYRTKFVLRCETDNGSQFLCVRNRDIFINAFDSLTHKHYHEYIFGDQPQKLRFDIDAAVADGRTFQDYENMYAGIIDSVHKVCKLMGLCNATVIECDSSNTSKLSRHIIIHGYYVQDNILALTIGKLLAGIQQSVAASLIDTEVYKSVQGFRILGCDKLGSGRVKRVIRATRYDENWSRINIEPVSITLRQTLITDITDCALYEPEHSDHDAIRTLYGRAIWKRDKKTEQKQKQFEAQHDIQDPVFAEFVKLSCEYAGSDHEINADRSSRTQLIFTRLSSSECDICGRRHDNDHTLFTTLSQHGNVRRWCFKTPGLSVFLGRINMNNAAEPVQERKPKITPEQRLRLNIKRTRAASQEPDEILGAVDNTIYVNESFQRPIEFHGGCNALLIRAAMGLGKTEQIVKYINDVITAEPNINIVAVSFRMSFTDKIIADLPKCFADYRKVKDINKHKYMVVQYESLHELKPAADRKYMLILDESESILGQMDNPILVKTNTRNKTWRVFEWLCRHSERIIAMDAYMSMRTVDLMQRCNRDIGLLYNEYKREGRRDLYYANQAAFESTILDHAENAAQNPFIVCANSKKWAKTIYEACCKRGVDQSKIALYTSEMNADKRRELEDVAKHWSRYDIIIYTSSISAGCSYKLARFTRVYGYFTNMSSDYQTAIQMLGRVRAITPMSDRDSHYHLYIKSPYIDSNDSIAAVESAILRTAGALKNYADNCGVDMILTSDCKLRPAYKDLYYWTAIGNARLKLRSRNNFIGLFMRDRLSSGFECGVHADSIKPLIEMAEARKTIAQNDLDAVMAAGIKIDKGEHVPAVEHDAAAERKIMIAKTYGVDHSSMTREFVEEYGDNTVMSQFRRLSTLFGRDRAVSENLGARANNNELIDDQRDNDNAALFGRDVAEFGKMAVMYDVINILTGGDFKNWKRINLKYTIAKSAIDGLATAACKYMERNCGVICKLFGRRASQMKDISGKGLAAKLKSINGIIYSILYLKIERESDTKNANYKLCSYNGAFTFSKLSHRYVPKNNYVEGVRIATAHRQAAVFEPVNGEATA